MSDQREDILTQIAENLDLRRLEITNLRRIILDHVGKPLESTAVRMSLPMLYALWEGYVKVACQLYIEHIEATVATANQLQPALLGYLWTPVLRRISGGLNFEHRKAIAEHALTQVSKSIKFEDREKTVNTRSNLRSSVLDEIANNLCLDISALAAQKHKLDTFVNIRNNIAHGSNPRRLRHADFEEHAEVVIWLMEEFERVLGNSIEKRSFCRRRTGKKSPRATRVTSSHKHTRST